MCGLAGFIDLTHQSHEGILQNMTRTLRHRGPDGEGFFFHTTASYQIGLGHQRLAILELSELGKQPYHFGDWVLVYNGELYNFQEIKISLQQRGYHFVSNGDTEVFIKAFDCWGIEAFSKFIGIFAFALYNQQSHQLYLGCDRAATKPLYFYFYQNVLLFGSELKALLAHPSFQKSIDHQAVALFFRYGYIPAPYSIFNHVQKIPLGTVYSFDCRERKLEKTSYWQGFQATNAIVETYNETTLLGQIEQLLHDSCRYRMVSDVPVGLFLSGGYDSSWVAYQIAQGDYPLTQTFTLGFEDPQYDEAHYANQLARELGLQHYTYTCSIKDASAILPQLPIIYDEPFGDSSAIPCVFLSKQASQHVKVILSADGGDEIFGGYTRYLKAGQTQKYLPKIPVGLRNLFIKNLGKHNLTPKVQKLIACLASDRQLLSLMHIQSQYYNQAVAPTPRSDVAGNSVLLFDATTDAINAMLAWDYQHYLPNDLMVKIDRACMRASIEAREPLLDHRLVEFMAGIQGNVKIQKGESKYLFKKIVHQHLPFSLMNRPKKGFSIPLAKWLRHPAWQEILQEFLHPDSLNEHHLLQTDVCRRYLQKCLAGDTSHTSTLWHILQFQLWYKQWGK